MQIVPEYESLDEFSKIAVELSEIHESHFAGLEVNLIKGYVITNKDRGESQKSLWSIKGVPMPILLDCPYAYYVIMFQSDWDSLSKQQKGKLVLDVLHGIPTDDDDKGKVLSMDMKDYATMLRTFGPDYMLNANGPDPFDKDIEWAEAPTNVFKKAK